MKTEVLLAVGFLFSGALLAQSTSTLSGTVTDPSGLPIARATVLLQSANGGAREPLHTDSAGGFVISLGAAGSYKLVISSPGFETKEIAITVGSEPLAPLKVRLEEIL